jgi:hypothetical protein
MGRDYWLEGAKKFWSREGQESVAGNESVEKISRKLAGRCQVIFGVERDRKVSLGMNLLRSYRESN